MSKNSFGHCALSGSIDHNPSSFSVSKISCISLLLFSSKMISRMLLDISSQAWEVGGWPSEYRAWNRYCLLCFLNFLTGEISSDPWSLRSQPHYFECILHWPASAKILVFLSLDWSRGLWSWDTTALLCPSKLLINPQLVLLLGVEVSLPFWRFIASWTLTNFSALLPSFGGWVESNSVLSFQSKIKCVNFLPPSKRRWPHDSHVPWIVDDVADL